MTARALTTRFGRHTSERRAPPAAGYHTSSSGPSSKHIGPMRQPRSHGLPILGRYAAAAGPRDVAGFRTSIIGGSGMDAWPRGGSPRLCRR